MIPLPALSLSTWLRIATGIAFALLLAWGLRVDHLRAGYKAALAKTIHDYGETQKQAQTDFDRKVAAIVAKNRSANDAADKKDADLRIVYRDRVVRLQPAPAGCAAQSPGLPTPDLPKGADGPGGDSVILARSDALICATNTARLEAVREWALGMK